MSGFRRIAALLVVALFLYPLAGLACDDRAVFTSAADATSMVELRAGPSADAAVLFSFYSCVGFEPLAHKDGWTAVRLPDVPGFADLPQGYESDYDGTLYPIGYLSDADIYEVGWTHLNTLFDQLPKVQPATPAQDTLVLLSAPAAGAAPQAVLLPGATLTVLGKGRGYNLVCTDAGVYGYLPEAAITVAQPSVAKPRDLFWERADYYAGFPFVFALVNTASDSDTLPLLQAPADDALVLAQLACGATVQVLADQTPYCRVRAMGDDGLIEGYLPRARLQVDGDAGKRMLTGVRDLRAQVTELSIPVRTFPDENAPLIVNTDAVDINILGIAGSWYYVCFTSWETEHGYIGYLRANQDLGYWVGTYTSVKDYGVIILPENKKRLPLYAGPSVDSQMLGSYFHATQVEVIETDAQEQRVEAYTLSISPLGYAVDPPDFYHVRVDGQEGYMQGAYIMLMLRDNPSQW